MIIRNGYDVLITLGFLETVIACLILSILILIHVSQILIYLPNAWVYGYLENFMSILLCIRNCFCRVSEAMANHLFFLIQIYFYFYS